MGMQKDKGPVYMYIITLRISKFLTVTCPFFHPPLPGRRRPVAPPGVRTIAGIMCVRACVRVRVRAARVNELARARLYVFLCFCVHALLACH